MTHRWWQGAVAMVLVGCWLGCASPLPQPRMASEPARQEAPVVTRDPGLGFRRPADLIFSTPGSALNGPPLLVSVDATAAGRLIFLVDTLGAGYFAVVEARDVPDFHLVTRGRDGASGSSGSSGADGSSGMDGSSASCVGGGAGDGSSGGDGQEGGPGEPGGDGGNGGDVQVDVHCAAQQCPAVVEAVRRIVSSHPGAGGSGGFGGRGGSGGRGGAGGAGASCSDATGSSFSVSGGQAGRNGADGPSGSNGSWGQAGRTGQVTFKVFPSPA